MPASIFGYYPCSWWCDYYYQIPLATVILNNLQCIWFSVHPIQNGHVCPSLHDVDLLNIQHENRLTTDICWTSSVETVSSPMHNYTRHTTNLKGVYWFHSIPPSVCPSVCPSIRLSRIPCQLCRAYSSGCIHFIFTHLIKQLQNINFCQFL